MFGLRTPDFKDSKYKFIGTWQLLWRLKIFIFTKSFDSNINVRINDGATLGLSAFYSIAHSPVII